MQKTFAYAAMVTGLLLGAGVAQAASLPAAAPVRPDATPQEAQRALQSVGFDQISALRQSGNIVRANAVYQGQPVRILLDTRNGRISDQAGPLAINVTPKSSDAAIRSELGGLGYTGLGEVTRRGNIYSVPAQSAGQPVLLRVNALNGRVSGATVPRREFIAARDDMDTSYVAQQLRAIGYTQVGDVSRSGNIYRAAASKDGAPVSLRIDGNTGAVTR